MRALMLIMLVLWPGAARAEDARAVIERFHANLLDVMKAGPQLGFDGRTQALTPAVAATFDLAGMTRTAMGAEAARVPPDLFDRLVEAFGRYTVANYARQFASWDGERFETGEPVPARSGGVLVPSRILPPGGEPVRLTYVMRPQEESWRVGDVLLEGTISQMAVRRAEFRAVLRRGGATALLQELDRRSNAMAAG